MGRNGPANLGRMGPRLRVASRAPRASRAATPRVSPRLAGPRGVTVPNGATGRRVSATTPFAGPPTKTINKAKTPGRPSGRISTRPRADGASRI